MLKQTCTTWFGLCLAATIAMAGCSSDSIGESTGALEMTLELAGGAQIDQVSYHITGEGMEPMSGVIDTSAPGATASVEVFGLLPGTGYLVELLALADGETACEGSAPFDVVAGLATPVAVMLNCKPPERFGSVRVNGKLNVCAELVKVVVAPLQTSVGSRIDLSSKGADADGDDIAYLWEAAGGPICNPDDATTTYTCTSTGPQLIRVSVSDDEFTACSHTWLVEVRCVDGDGGAGGSAGSGGAGGMGGSGGTGGSGGDAGTLGLVQTVPADLATEVSTDIVVTAEFDAALNEASVTASSFRLGRDGGADVEGSVAVAGQTASYTPARALGLLSSYTATLTTAIEALSGQTLEMSHSWGFRTRDGQWGDPVSIEIGHAASRSDLPQVALDPNGNAVAVWFQWDGTRNNIWANRFTLAAGWGEAELLETDNAGDAFWPEVALDPNGNAVAVWFQSDGTRSNIWANRFTPSGGWGEAELLETDNAGDASLPQVALDPNGNAVAVWQQVDGTRFNVWSNRFTLTAGWGAAELLETDDAGDAFTPQVAFDPNGNAVAVWSQSDGTRTSSIWSNRFTLATGWGAAELLETDNAGNASNPQVALDPDGNAVAVWFQWDGTRSNIWSNRFTLAAGWGAAELLETDDVGNAQGPQVALDSNGNAVAVWYQSDGTGISIWANRFTPSGGWGAAELLETDAGQATDPQVALDPNGNAVAVWEQFDGTRFSIWANRFTPAAGWGAAELLETDNAVMAHAPQVALDSSGNAVAVWFQSDGTRSNIWANRFE